MTTQDVTLTLPEPVYEQLRLAAAKANRSIDDILVEAVIAAAPVMGSGGERLRLSLAQIAVGRATVAALQMNHMDIVAARGLWVSVGWHPPTD